MTGFVPLLRSLRPHLPTTPGPSHPLRWAWRLVRRHRRLLAVTVVLRVTWELVPMLSPLVVGYIIDALTAGSPARSEMTFACLLLLAFGAVRGIAVGAYSEASARLGLAVVTDARSAVFAHLRSKPDHHLSVGDLMTRAVRDPGRLNGFIDRVFVRSVTVVSRAAFPAAMLFILNPTLALWVLAPIPVQQLVLGRLQRHLQRATRAAADAHAALTDEVHRQLSSTPAPADDALEAAARELERRELASKRLVAGLRAWVWLCMSAGIALLWFHGTRMVDEATLTVGGLVGFAGYVGFIYRPFRQLTQVVKSYESGRASLERIVEIIDRK